MSVFKCKMCGGTLSVQDGSTVAECEYCGTTQTVPTSNDEVIVNLFNRANNLRLKGDFDKAVEVYEKILDLDNTLAEAHWGVVLCKYGVEYVEDPLTKERIPTCHRTQMTSLLTDTDYQAVLQYADSTSRAVYEEQAAAINELQKRILEIVKSEKPFDVFICYKETDESGARTKDSVIANEIYHELTNSGLKVFFAAITLEDKLGQEYEPYIFAALTSAKVMLVLGTKSEYFNAVWVKNEWSRYLHLMKTDRQTKRTLIPCFRDMDAYDLPDEFSHLQALDMANIAFMPDLSRNIKKLIGTEDIGDTVSESSTQSVAPLLRRAFMLIEDDDFEHADELLETVLDQDPENAKAYLGKLMVKLQVHDEDELQNSSIVISEEPHFKKACRFADDEFLTTLMGYSQAIIGKALEEKNQVYKNACDLMEQGLYEGAYNLFNTIKDHNDSGNLAEKCHELYMESLHNEASVLLEDGRYDEAYDTFGKIVGYRDADVLRTECRYRKAVLLLYQEDFDLAIQTLESISDYKNSKELIKKCTGTQKRSARIASSKDRFKRYLIFIGVLILIAVSLLFSLEISGAIYNSSDLFVVISYLFPLIFVVGTVIFIFDALLSLRK